MASWQLNTLRCGGPCASKLTCCRLIASAVHMFWYVCFASFMASPSAPKGSRFVRNVLPDRVSAGTT